MQNAEEDTLQFSFSSFLLILIRCGAIGVGNSTPESGGGTANASGKCERRR